MNPELEALYQQAFAALTKQVEERFAQLEQQLGALASHTAASDSSKPSGAGSAPRMITVETREDAWAFPLSSVSHFVWGNEWLRVCLVTSSGEKQVELRLQGAVTESLRPVWAKLAENIASGTGPLSYPADLSGARITATVK